MGGPIKSSQGVAGSHQSEITGRASGMTPGSISIPKRTNLEMRHNAKGCVSARHSAVSGARSNLLASADGIASLASRFAAMDAEMQRQNAAIGK